MPPSERSLGTISTSEVEKNRVRFFDFVKITFPSPTGVKRYTNKPGGFVGDIDGSSQTWDRFDVRLGPIAQAMHTILDVSWVEFGNLNNVFSVLVLNTDVEGRRVEVWQAWFNPETDAKLGQYRPYRGRIEKALCRETAKVSLVPEISALATLLPARVIGPVCGYIFKDTRTCQYVGADTTCDHTRAACAAKSNLAHFGGFDQLPPENKAIVWRPTGA